MEEVNQDITKQTETRLKLDKSSLMPSGNLNHFLPDKFRLTIEEAKALAFDRLKLIGIVPIKMVISIEGDERSPLNNGIKICFSYPGYSNSRYEVGFTVFGATLKNGNNYYNPDILATKLLVDKMVEKYDFIYKELYAINSIMEVRRKIRHRGMFLEDACDFLNKRLANIGVVAREPEKIIVSPTEDFDYFKDLELIEAGDFCEDDIDLNVLFSEDEEFEKDEE